LIDERGRNEVQFLLSNIGPIFIYVWYIPGEYAGDSSDVADKKTNSSTFSYSMEKYMDPNRPFKCDVCKESFTQKNILLVHYNSVSHLHRLKKTMQEQQQHNQSASTSSATPEKSSKSSALEALLGNIRGEKKDDDEVKPFKCNICKVAYSQGSTLDIHIRSVLHQTKASKLQELILTGQIDMSKPLIEQPDPQQLQEQHKKMIADMLLSPKSLNSTGSSNPQTSPNVRSSSPGHSTTPQSSPLTNIQALMATKNESSGGGTTDEEKTTLKSLAKTFPMLSNLTSTPTSSAIDDKAPPVLKNLLQNYGLDLVKQFSEMHQKRQRDDSYGETAPQQPSKKKAKDEHQVRLNGDDSPPSGGGDRAATPAGSVSSNTDKESPNNNKGQPNLAEMQEALQRAMMGAQLQQMNPMMMQMAQLQGLNPLVAMNLYPPLIPPHLLKQGGGGGGQDLLAQLQSNPLFQAGGMDPKLLALMSATRPQMPPQMSEQPKNIAQMMGLLAQSQPMPQMNQDSKNFLQMAQMGFDPKMLEGFHAGPPNFNMQRSDGGGPGGLMLPQQPIAPQDQSKRARTRISDDQLKILRNNFDINNSPSEDTLNNMAQQTGLPLKVIKHWFRNTLFKERQKNKDSPYNFNNPPSTKLNLEEYEKTGESKVTPVDSSDQEEYIKYEAAKKEQDKESKLEDKSAVAAAMDSQNANANSKVPTTHTSSASVNDIISSSNMAEASLTLSRLLGSHLTPGALGGATGQQPPPLLPNFPAFPMTTSSLSTTPPMPEYLTTLARQNPRPQSPMSVGSNQGKRANRTRFTDYQIKVLQEFFENNAYPKDDDLEYLSKLLGLSPRVIVVWFQNARQKARKIYENQPPTEATEGDEASGRFTRTSGCNYQCKKCLLVFQRYYELIRHQKQHCYKEEDARKSALAQKAAGQAAASFVGPPPPLIPHSEEESRSSGGGGDDRSLTSPATPANMSIDHDRNALLNYPPHTPFGILQQQALHQQQQQQQQHQHQQQQQHQQQHQHLQQQLHNNPDSGDEFDESESLASSPSSKRKLSDDGDMDEESIQRREKRLRTTILPEQLDFLYQKYQVESNPSRKMLEQIATEVGLRKRVVQVWFQNTRARERKGHYRAQNQVINKRCPFCSAHFKVRSALEAHLATKHPDQPTGIVDIDALPNVDISSEDGDNNGGGGGTNRDTPPPPPFNMSDQIASLMPTTTTSAAAFDLQNSMRKYYEDTMKRFMNDLADQKQQHPEPSHQLNTSQSPNHHQQALDLTSSFNTEDCGSSDHGQGDGNDSDHNNRSIDGSSMGNGNSKRFRTQMSGVQVKMMKAIFEAYKTPTMTECSNLGREIGLQKRVVQVWFQNARAKEKRARLQLQQATGREPEGYMPPDHCIVCPGFTFGQRFAIQDHLFTKAHLENLRVALEQGRYDPESPGTKMAQAAAALQQSNGQGAVARPNSSNGPSDQTALSMLQMTTQVNNSHELLDIPARQNPRMLMQV
jgi:AT-binding transcription factor 1